MNFTKIKRSKDGEVTLRWTTDSKRDSVKHELTSFDKPEPEFDAALQAFVPEVVKLLELPEEYAKGMKAIGVSLTHNDEQGLGCVVTCLKELAGANAPLVLNTPHMVEESENAPMMSGAMSAAIEVLEDCAKRFHQGHREQQDMFGDEAIRDAVAGLAPKEGSGIESVTISAGGESVTLKAGDGEKIRRGKPLKDEVADAFDEMGILA